ncbi:MAG TPA: MFS transporter [Rhodopila sp.]|uniref:MFS transporter n=1 Tax=Rhodopila sp. TaxID=2480087 RepID=UPI002CA731E0|nr:MFS transporter [Rhodopila sp.]HVY18252.1 MFS transporter [Rhodopila sp.]
MPIVTPPRVRAAQRSALTVLVVAGTLNYIDRATLSVANPLIRQDMGLSIADMGLLLSAFLWAYAFFQLPGGALVDRVGPRRLLTVGLTIWSVAQAAAGFVGNFTQFSVARVFLGAGEAPMFSSCVRVVRDWFAARQRGLGMGICNTTSSLGPAISPPILTFLMLSFGWRWMFIIMGVAGVVIAAIWYFVYRDVRETRLTAEEKAFLSEGEEAVVEQQVTFKEWRSLFAFRTTWGLIVGFFGIVYVTWLFQSWLPGYLEIQRHMSIRATGFIASIPFIFGVIGSVGFGWVTDKLNAAGFSPVNSRKIPIIAGLVGMAVFTYIAAEASSNFIAVAAISAAVFCNGGSSGQSWSLASVAAPANCTASLGSIMNFGGYIGGALAPTITGFIVQATGSFEDALLVGAAMAVVGALSYVAIVRRDPIHATELDAGMVTALGN